MSPAPPVKWIKLPNFAKESRNLIAATTLSATKPWRTFGCWRQAKINDSIRGIIQLSVGFFHLLSHNFRGAESQWEKGIAKLADYDDEHLGVNLKTLLAKMQRCHDMLEAVREGRQAEFDWALAPQIITTW